MLQKIILTINFVFLLNCFLIAQDKFLYELQKKPQTKDAPSFEVALFNGAAEITTDSRLTFFLKVVYDELQFIKSKGKKFQADYEISVSILDTSGQVIVNQKNTERVIAQNFNEVNSTDLFKISKVYFDLTPETYSFKVEFKDLETRRSSLQEGSVTLREYSGSNLMISEIIFRDSLTIEDKNKLEMTSDDLLEKKDWTKLFAYFEVYNVPEKDSMNLNFEIRNPDEEIVFSKDFWHKSEGRVTPFLIEIEQYEKLKGKIGVKIKIVSTTDSLLVDKNPISFYRVDTYFDLTNLQDAIEKLVYIAKKDELKKLKKAEGEKQEKEFKKFWKKRDPTPGTPRNEYFDEYYKRVEFADKKFSDRGNGWKTEMGMVYIKLGPPNYIEKPVGYEYYDRTSFDKPPQIWYYHDLNRRVIFSYRAGDYRIANYNEVFDILNDEMRL